MPGHPASSLFPLGRPARLAVLASGRGTNLQALLDRLPPDLGRVALVVADRAEAGALERAREAGVRAELVPFPRGGRDAFEARLEAVLAEERVDLVCLAGFMRLLSPSFAARWAGRLLNVHPSLLPAFPGLEPHARALAAGAAESGCTVHFVDDGVDTGPAIVQRRVPVLPYDTPGSLAARILPLEHEAYVEAVRLVLCGAAAPAAR